MALRETRIPLYEDAFYSMSMSFEGNSYKLEFLYNEEAELYSFSLYDELGIPLVLGLALVPFYPIAMDYSLTNLSGGFLLVPKERVADTEPYKRYPDKIHKYYDFLYVYDAEE